MSAYKATGGFTPPQGARANNLSGQVPSNQMWAQAYNQASNQYGGNTQAQSWTMPGFSSSYNPMTGQYSQPTGGQSGDGNMAYQSIDSRPGPITATATGVNGQSMPWQDTLTQREAFAGNLSQRLGQYSSGQLTGPPTFDTNQLMSQANDQLAKGTFYNPFSQQNPDVQRAIGNSAQYATGTQWQNPFGNSPQANNPMPSLSQATYDPTPRATNPFGGELSLSPRPGATKTPDDEGEWRSMLEGSWDPGPAQENFYKAGIARGYRYDPVTPPPPARPPVAPARPPAAPARPPQDDFQQFLEQRGMMDDYRSWTAGRAQPIESPSQGTPYGEPAEPLAAPPAKPPMRTSGGGGVTGRSARMRPARGAPTRRARQA
jgi:hypothetical protein